MNFNKYKVGILGALLFSATACSVEDIQPINQLTEELVITNEASANNVLNRIYSHQRSFDISSMAAATGYYGVMQDELFGLFGGAGFSTNNVLDDSQLLNTLYTGLYATINDANYFIELIEAGSAVGLEEIRQNEMLSEARFFRALSHFYLLRIFGEFYDTASQYGVVTSTSPISNTDPITRSTVQQTYDAIVADLEYAVTNGGSGREHFYVSTTTAQALLAKVYLYSGDFSNAASMAAAVINNFSDTYDLEASYSDIFANRWESPEVLFAPFVDGFNEGSASTDVQFRSSTMPSFLFTSLADESDGAVDGTFDFFGFPDAGYDSRYLYTYSAFTRGSNSNGKYPYATFSQNSDAGNTYYYIRMAEVYLIYAEAEARRAGGDLNAALTRLNDIRNRAGMPVRTLVDQATLLDDIRTEKVLELSTENGEDYYDLIRYHRLGDLDTSVFKATLTEDKHIFPIPASALAGNSLLVPNPNQ